MIQNNPRLVAQRRLAEFIQNSPRVQAQARREAEMLGAPSPANSTPARKPVQRKATGLQKQGPTVGPRMAALAPRKPSVNRTGLPDALKTGMESLSGVDLSDVRVHANSKKPAELNALAYAQGHEIHLAPGQEQHLPHEAWHVVQQKQGRVRATGRVNNTPVADVPQLEAEADTLGARSARFTRATSWAVTAETSGGTVQRAAHRPAESKPAERSQVEYQGAIYDVIHSAEGNPQIQLRLAAPPQTLLPPITWATAAYKIIRANNQQDHDLRENNPAQGVDAYAALTHFEHLRKVKMRFHEARDRALEMIKAHVLGLNLPQALRPGLDAIRFNQFEPTKRSVTSTGTREPCEWEYHWTEGSAQNPRRRWTFGIDSDDPPPDSPQEPHVGWNVSAVGGTQDGVQNTYGHVWLDHVPVARPAP